MLFVWFLYFGVFGGLGGWGICGKMAVTKSVGGFLQPRCAAYAARLEQRNILHLNIMIFLIKVALVLAIGHVTAMKRSLARSFT